MKGSNQMNRYAVGAVGKKVEINNLAQRPQLTPREALELAAWLVAVSAPLMPGDATAVLNQFHKLLADAAEGTDLEGPALAEIEE
jgi:cytochrome c